MSEGQGLPYRKRVSINAPPFPTRPIHGRFVRTELARGDLDRDGNEDALVAVAWAYRGGSGNGFHTVVIRRTDPKARLAVDPMPLP